jgi:hypothetical protein
MNTRLSLGATPRLLRHAILLSGFWLLSLWGAAAWAHSSSNSYLTLSAPNEQLRLRADVHWRDVDLMFDLDRDRDGQVTWGEAQAREAELQVWLNEGLSLSASGERCTLGAADLQASQRADGLYLSAVWTPDCPSLSGAADGVRWVLRYGLMFAQDDSHRGLLKVDLPGLQSSALLSPQRPEAELSIANDSALAVLGRYVVEGVWHIWIGIDHIVFLLSLLVLAPLQPARERVVHWQAASAARPVLLDVLAVVTAFTVAHSITLGLTITGWLTPPADWVEPAIALSVVLAALNNLLGFSALKRWRLAFVFGLIHGFGFASVLLDLGLPASTLLVALGGFNLGVELGQLAIVAVFFPLAWALRRTGFYRWGVVAGGSGAVVLLGLIWTLQRVGVWP